jgi:uncharacterized protein (DUF1697 family)
MNATTYTFDAVIQKVPNIDGAYIAVPLDVKAVFGKGRVPVHATFDGIAYDGSVVNMGVKNANGSVCYILGIPKAIRARIGKQPGDTVHVAIIERAGVELTAVHTEAYLALFRGINVGGKNVIKMEALKATFEALGFTGVTTYIQSGNVVFRGGGVDTAALAATLEAGMEAAFALRLRLVVLTAREVGAIVDGAPAGYGEDADYRHDVWFLKPPLTAAEVLAHLQTREGVDRVWAGTGAVYTARLIREATKSRVHHIIQFPDLYRNITIRNWNTTKALGELVRGA